MHDIGKLLILQQHTKTYDRVLRRGIEEGIETIEAEVREFPFDHTQVGHLIAERWHFAPELTNVISRHHRPWKDIPQVSVTSLVKAANIIVHALGLGAGREATQMKKIYEPMLNDTWNHLAVPDPVRQELLDKAASTFEDERSLYESWSGG
jgi:HD-like signal output (HDOD) protein